jgi:hypothetical protein
MEFRLPFTYGVCGIFFVEFPFIIKWIGRRRRLLRRVCGIFFVIFKIIKLWSVVFRFPFIREAHLARGLDRHVLKSINWVQVVLNPLNDTACPGRVDQQQSEDRWGDCLALHADTRKGEFADGAKKLEAATPC